MLREVMATQCADILMHNLFAVVDLFVSLSSVVVIFVKMLILQNYSLYFLNIGFYELL
jgi:hypothetical protein